ncbi:DNA alkylation repair protein [Phenylobacterium sp.]|jgi:3-methyladenine DNA glycosylase AlkD|uniref:DNA alkylation repair protein n=1 Tax=Phenylobacterium sp. TaxID=1871053 RepID=UPI002E2FD020|nr:DNA alkylation repair protein [Phenylobacterium sp.]HEX2558945.1 DNA alkylation repair protein [Phenylobacterium sp.]
MHPEHARLLEEIRKAGRPPTLPPPGNDSFGSSGRISYIVSVPQRRAIAKAWAQGRRRTEPAEALAVVESLLTGESFEERTLATFLLAYHAPARRAVRPQQVERWLGQLNGWAEVDGLCQSLFPADQLLADWPAWRSTLERLAGENDPNKRRASLVLLTGPVKGDEDERLKAAAFENVERLQGERDPLITKALSWLLRALCHRHGPAVADYLARRAGELPAIAVRETRTKLATGVKTPRRPRERV